MEKDALRQEQPAIKPTLASVCVMTRRPSWEELGSALKARLKPPARHALSQAETLLVKLKAPGAVEAVSKPPPSKDLKHGLAQPMPTKHCWRMIEDGS